MGPLGQGFGNQCIGDDMFVLAFDLRTKKKLGDD